MIETLTGFSALGLSEETLEALNEKGYENPTPIQSETIPLLMHGTKDIVGQAQTGSGKTAAFGIPLIEKYDPTIDGVQALVLTPTRELALQVSDEIQSYKGGRKIWLTTVYGGAPISRQMKDLEKGTDIVVGTPGRVIDLIKRKKLILDDVRYVVLDEADEMLNMGFLEDVEYILSMCNEERRMLLFSATMPKRILDLAKRYMGEYELIAVKNKTLTTASINQQYFEVPSRSRFDALCRILDVEEDFYGIVFCNTKAEVVEITNHLNEKGYTSDSLHGDIAQNLREQVIRQFKSNNFGLLIATDVAARGIDIHDLTHVINYGLPQDPESYVHRIGRTGRAGKDGKAISIIDSNERRKLQYIQRLTKAEITKVKLPDAKEMVAIKKRRISEQVETVISTEKYASLMEFTHELLRENEPEMVIASLLKIFRGDDLDVNEYKDLQIVESRNRKERSSRNDRDSGRRRDRDNDRGGRKRRDNSGGATMRLFVAMGRKDKISPRDILEMIGSETNVSSNKIDDIKILDAFSFFTTNEEDGEFILKTFKKKARTDNQKPLIEQARDRR